MAVAAPLNLTRSGHVVIGVHTKKYVHVAAVVDSILASLTIATDTGGYQQLLDWATRFGQIIGFGIEGTGSYGAALASFVRRNGYRVIEVNRPDRRMRRLIGTSDSLDAENAARAVLAGFAIAGSKTTDGTVEKGPAAPPDTFGTPPPRPDVPSSLEPWVRARAAWRHPAFADIRIASSWSCFYEMTPDDHPIVGRVPDVEGLYIAAGFSGHGFMHAPATAQLIVEEMLDGKATTLDIADLSLERFRTGRRPFTATVL